MSVWEDIRIMCDSNRTVVDSEQHRSTQPAGSTAVFQGSPA